MALNFSPDVSFDNMQDWEGMRKKAGEADSAIADRTNDETWS
jgi:hypothetical protein